MASRFGCTAKGPVAFGASSRSSNRPSVYRRCMDGGVTGCRPRQKFAVAPTTNGAIYSTVTLHHQSGDVKHRRSLGGE